MSGEGSSCETNDDCTKSNQYLGCFEGICEFRCPTDGDETITNCSCSKHSDCHPEYTKYKCIKGQCTEINPLSGKEIEDCTKDSNCGGNHEICYQKKCAQLCPGQGDIPLYHSNCKTLCNYSKNLSQGHACVQNCQCRNHQLCHEGKCTPANDICEPSEKNSLPLSIGCKKSCQCKGNLVCKAYIDGISTCQNPS